GSARTASFTAKMAELSAARALCEGLALTPNEAVACGLNVNLDGIRRNVHQLLAYPEIDFEALSKIWPELQSLSPAVIEQLEIDARYAGYLERQQADIIAFRKDEELHIPDVIDYDSVGGLSAEMREKLKTARPFTLGQASRIDGMTPAALTALLRHVKRVPRADTRIA
ncbi:MAG: tRNA uridine-5-carboxymethylaminomethyl(34) synthesis enzyme MnmG, partial [Gammaproteobacteria bacterium]|nr:tRNA uridine-5-carboxymethylaminomethyl(34) synthesis enzyme MnmG [Gammaproteobacteria bacterium]